MTFRSGDVEATAFRVIFPAEVRPCAETADTLRQMARIQLATVVSY